ncbi:MAG: GNAT superfamily N-acetyltransferase [Flavobacteriaceae bacterium]|jgi:GNAT superfamily N-acetyltransferase
MELREIKTKQEMLDQYGLLCEVYPSLTIEEYSTELDSMLPHNYGQVGVFEGDECLGMTGYWIGTKLWCGKYIELDNVVVSEQHRGKGIGELLFKYMEEKAKELNVTMLSLDSYTDNFKAHKFFYGQGYAPRGFHFINILDKSGVR